jgi:hypothetical protein
MISRTLSFFFFFFFHLIRSFFFALTGKVLFVPSLILSPSSPGGRGNQGLEKEEGSLAAAAVLLAAFST